MKHFAIYLIAAATLLGCKPEIEAPQPDAGTANFTKVVYMGDNFMSGYQDGALFKDGQEKSLPALLSRQFQHVGGGSVNQPLMPNNSGLGINSKPYVSDFISKSDLGYKVDCEGVESLSPLKDEFNVADASAYLQPLSGSNYHNMAVPFANTSNMLDPNFGLDYNTSGNPYYHRFASNPGTSTIAGDAAAQSPTFVNVWLGMEEIFNYARNGGVGVTIPSSGDFSNRLDQILAGVIGGDTKGAIATIPNIRSFPYYTLVAWNGADITQSKADSLNDIYHIGGANQHIQWVEGANPFIIADANAPNGFRQMYSNEIITLSIPIDSMKCFGLGVIFSSVPDQYSLDSTEVTFVEQMINEYNNVIRQKASQYGLALVNMNTYFDGVVDGVLWNGVDFDAEFVSGGFYGLDGYHPNQKGYAQLANEFIKAINATYGASIPTTNCFDCDGVIFP